MLNSCFWQMTKLQTSVQSIMAATGVYTSWSGYLHWNHVTDLKVRTIKFARFSSHGLRWNYIDHNFQLFKNIYSRLNKIAIYIRFQLRFSLKLLNLLLKYTYIISGTLLPLFQNLVQGHYNCRLQQYCLNTPPPHSTHTHTHTEIRKITTSIYPLNLLVWGT